LVVSGNTNVRANNLQASVAPDNDASCAISALEDHNEASSPVIRFEELYDAWFHQVSCWVQAMGARNADRDDLVQDVFMVVYRRLTSFDGQNLGGWLYQITRRKVRDYRHLAWIKHFFATSTVLPFDARLGEFNNPLQELQTREGYKLMNELLAALSVDERATFVLFEVEGQTGEQIAQLQNVPINTVWARLYRARKKLQHHLRGRKII
jgi:RNA polymerase sigma-70 factor (ECF subfamily)